MDILSPRSLSRAFLSHGRVVQALMLRDIKTRFGASYFGFLVGQALPLGHIGIVTTAYVIMGRRAPIGTEAALFFATGLLPFIIWTYTHQKVMQSVSQNKSLTFFPIIKHSDILIARSLVELMNGTVICIVVYLGLTIIGFDTFINDITGMAFALAMAYLYGISTGTVFALLSNIFPAIMIVGFVLVPLNLITSGVFFIPEILPEIMKEIVWIFPLSHIVDVSRQSFYSSYFSDYPDMMYVSIIILFNIFLTFAMERFLRVILTTR